MMFFSLLLGICFVLLCIVTLLMVARRCLLVATVQGESMAPTLLAGERVLVWRLFPTRRLREGQIILVSQEEKTPDTAPYIKRIIALQGEICTMSPRMTKDTQEQSDNLYEERTWHIPAGSVFVCGDNQAKSIDSRTWGPLSQRRILGHVLLKLPRSSAVSTPSSSSISIPQQGPPRGAPAPAFRASTIQGEDWTQQTCGDQARLLLFIRTDVVARRNMPIYRLFFQAVQNMQIRSVIVCDAVCEEATIFSAEMQITQPLLIAPRDQNPFFKDYHIDITPSYCLINEQGIVCSSGPASQQLFSHIDHVTRYMGFIPKDTAETNQIEGAYHAARN